MKKSIISLVVALSMLISMMSGFTVAAQENTDVLSFAEIIAKDVYGANTNIGTEILQNEKYVFVVEGAPCAGFENRDIHVNTKIHIYEKPNSEHLDYKYLTAIRKAAGSTVRDVPARNVEVIGDMLYVAWGNAVYTKNAHATNPAGGDISYAAVYDVSEVEEGVMPKETKIQTSLEQRVTTHVPFIRGGILAKDEETGKVYVSGVSRTSYGRREYFEFDDVDVAAYMTGQASSLSRKTVLAPVKSQNTVKFVVKDGLLFEILQQKGGLIDFSGNNTLKDANGETLNNSIQIYDVSAFAEIGAPDTKTAQYMVDYKKGEYTTETPGSILMNDVAVGGDYMYVATKKGLEVVNISAAKDATETALLVCDQIMLENTEVYGVEVSGDKLYAGTTEGMIIYDISAGVPSLISEHPYEGGFKAFEISEEEGLIYALSAKAKGGALIIDMSTLSGGLEVADFEFTQNDAAVEEIEAGNISFGASVTNASESRVEFKTAFALYKDNKLIDIIVDEYSIEAKESTSVGATLTAPDKEGLNAKVIFLNANDEAVPFTENGKTLFEKEIGTMPNAESVSEDAVDVSEIDEMGSVAVSGAITTFKNLPLLVSAKNTENDTYAFIDVVTLDEEGKYSTLATPKDSGLYEFKVSKIYGSGAATKEVSVPNLSLTLQNTVEVPGIDSYLYVEFENGQNIEKLEINVAFDKDAIEASEEISVSDEFVASDIAVEEGGISMVLTKKAESKLTTAKNEFCIIPIKVADDAVVSDYDLSLNVKATDEFENELIADANGGVLSVVESTPKYDALEEAVEALEALKEADKIEVDEYLDEKAKVEKAREKVNAAYEYFIRDSQMGTELIANLEAAEAKLIEIKPYYDAVDSLNAAEGEDLAKALSDNKEYFGISEEAFDIYDALEETEAIDKAMAETAFEKPSDVNKQFCEVLVLAAFPQTNWQNVETLIGLASQTGEIDTEKFEKLTSKQKAEACKTLALTEFEDLDELSDALDNAVKAAKEVEEETVRPSGSGGGGGSKGHKEYYVQPEIKQEENKPVNNEVFKDIASFGWAKDAINTLYEKGVISGKANGVFAPSDNVTREEFAKMISLAFKIDKAQTDAMFTDVNKNAWYSEFINNLVEAGIIKGRDNGAFGVGDNITREDIAVILERVAIYKGISLNDGIEGIFADETAISPYAKGAVAKMYAQGIISGYPDSTVRPKGNATRAEAAQLIYKLLTLSK